LVIVLTVSLGVWGCFDRDQTPTEPGSIPEITLNASNPAVQSVMAVQNRHTSRLMADPDVIGTATGLTDDGEVAIMVLVTSRRAADAVPRVIEGVRVKIRMTDRIMAVKGRPGGALVQGGGKTYILSNSHVFAGDIASSAGDPDVAQIGNPINQPGVIDVGCANLSADYVANLSSLSTLNTGANVDCAIAEVIAGAVRTDGSILEIGTISATTVSAFVGQAVKKSGRTTGLTRSVVEGLNASVNVGYEDECNGQSFTKLFTGQILVDGRVRGKSFLSGGDSGSLMVEDEDPNPNAVGLLFAGSSSIAVANPINEVLAHHNVSMVGN
jgi:hypothetical protein